MLQAGPPGERCEVSAVWIRLVDPCGMTNERHCRKLKTNPRKRDVLFVLLYDATGHSLETKMKVTQLETKSCF